MLPPDKREPVIGQIETGANSRLQGHDTIWADYRDASAAEAIHAEVTVNSAAEQVEIARNALKCHEQQYREENGNREPPAGVKRTLAKCGFWIVAFVLALLELPLTSAALQNFFPTDFERILASIALCAAPIGLSKVVGSSLAKKGKTFREDLGIGVMVLFLASILVLVAVVRGRHLKEQPPEQQHRLEVHTGTLRGGRHV